MKAEITKASSFDWREVREIASLEALLALGDEFHCSLIVSQAGHAQEHDIEVTLYDDYVE